jgi:hypothetical protein
MIYESISGLASKVDKMVREVLSFEVTIDRTKYKKEYY